MVYFVQKFKLINFNLEELVKEKTATLQNEVLEHKKAEEALIDSSIKL